MFLSLRQPEEKAEERLFSFLLVSCGDMQVGEIQAASP